MDMARTREELHEIEQAIEAFCKTVESTGGVIDGPFGYEPYADREWIDLGDAYVRLCRAIGREPEIEHLEDEEE